MGNRGSTNDFSNCHGLVRQAHAMNFDQEKLIQLRDACFRTSRQGSTAIDRRRFNIALENIGITGRYEICVLNYLFNKWDNRKDGQVDIIVFCVGVSPLACTLEDPMSAYIVAALSVLDVTDSKRISRANGLAMISAIMVTTSFLGEKVLSSEEVETIVKDAFRKYILSLSHFDFVKQLTKHPQIHKFATCEGCYRVKPESIKSSIKLLALKKRGSLSCHKRSITGVASTELFHI